MFLCLPLGNLALKKPARQSSTYGGAVAGRAVDGISKTAFRSGSCTHTKKELRPWWRVDLGKKVLVKLVTVLNRGDCCADRLSNFEIYVGSRGLNPRSAGNKRYVDQGRIQDMQRGGGAVGEKIVTPPFKSPFYKCALSD